MFKNRRVSRPPRYRHKRLRPNGTLVDRVGYDPATGLLYQAHGAAISINGNPTLDDARHAAQGLRELVSDFPFVSEAHVSACLAAIITPFARFAFRGPAPLFLIDGNTPATGKSLLADVVALIACGHRMPRNACPASDEEMRKQITSLAISGTRLVLLDNISGAFGWASLDALLTATNWRDRVLGKSEMASTQTLHTLWFATGSNVQLKGDICRRILHIRLESIRERPEERTDFAHPQLVRWIESMRDGYVRAALTILRAYHAAGRPPVPLESWGSFDEWSRNVRAPLVWCGLPDPAATRRGLAASADEERSLISRVFAAVAAIDVHGGGVTTDELIERIELPEHREHRTCVVRWVGNLDENGDPRARNLANKLRHVRNRIVDGLQLVREDDRWGIRRMTSIAGCESPRSSRSACSESVEDAKCSSK